MSESTDRVAAWMEVLGRIERSLEQSLSLTPEVTAVARREDGRPVLLDRLDGRLGQWQACLGRIEREAAQAQAELDAARESVRAWGEGAARAKELLSEWLRRDG